MSTFRGFYVWDVYHHCKLAVRGLSLWFSFKTCSTEGQWGARGQTYLPVCHADEPFVDQLVRFGVSGLPLHDVALRRLISQRDCWNLGARRRSTLHNKCAGIYLCRITTKKRGRERHITTNLWTRWQNWRSEDRKRAGRKKEDRKRGCGEETYSESRDIHKTGG